MNTEPCSDCSALVQKLRERIEELELRLDVYNGNMYDVVVKENERLHSRIAKLEKERDEKIRLH